MILLKNNFRKKVISLRNEQSSNFVDTHSNKIISNLLALKEFKTASTIMIYLDFNNEVKTDYLAKFLINSGKNVLVPITLKKERLLIPSQIKNLDSDLAIGTYGIREPKDECKRITSIDSIDILIVPAVAFDINKYRLGYGGGFYDRFIEKLRKDAITIGIAFDFQVFNTIPKESHDAKLDYIVTESRIIK